MTVSPLILQKEVLRGASGVNIYVYVDKPTVQWTWNTHSADKYWKLRFLLALTNIYFRHKPTGVMIPTHLKVLTIVEEPFIEHVPNLK